MSPSREGQVQISPNKKCGERESFTLYLINEEQEKRHHGVFSGREKKGSHKNLELQERCKRTRTRSSEEGEGPGQVLLSLWKDVSSLRLSIPEDA
ncbi:hypothetical protein JOB18_006662 [Solea senegalensis]|uniref:Uncharacterized protein n=1 Tax=Solea senegalensis TaxID=28829 RepID=A0AAV6RWT1_SOLSE|nr:hypothetical protein JOB18_006662 [Solea senegalensis]